MQIWRRTVKTDSAATTPIWFAELWAVESAKLNESLAKSGITVTPIRESGRPTAPWSTTISFVPTRKTFSSSQTPDVR